MFHQRLLLLLMATGVYFLTLAGDVEARVTIRSIHDEGHPEENEDTNIVSGASGAAVAIDGENEMQLPTSFIEAWIDAILDHARQVMRKKGLNQIQLPPEKSEFSRNILGIKFHGVASIYDGYLRGLETIHRTGVVSIKHEKSSGDLIATFEVGVNEPSVRAKALAKFLSIGPSGNILGSFDKVRVKMIIRISKNSGLKAHLDTFEITELGKLSMEIEGLGRVFNYLVENIVEGLGNRVFKRKVREILEGTIKKFIVNDILKTSLSTFSIIGGSNNISPTEIANSLEQH